MKTISIQRPWPEAIFREEKTIECRSWKTDYRGTLAIHVSQKAWCDNLFDESYYQVKGKIVGTVELINIIEFFGQNTFHYFNDMHLIPMGNWTKYGWVLENPVRFATPIPYRGKLGLWESPRHADLCKHASAFERGLLDSTHCCGVDVVSDDGKTWFESIDDVRMINADGGGCDDYERWEKNGHDRTKYKDV